MLRWYMMFVRMSSSSYEQYETFNLVAVLLFSSTWLVDFCGSFTVSNWTFPNLCSIIPGNSDKRQIIYPIQNTVHMITHRAWSGDPLSFGVETFERYGLNSISSVLTNYQEMIKFRDKWSMEICYWMIYFDFWLYSSFLINQETNKTA